MKYDYESPVSVGILMTHPDVICASFDPDHMTEILLNDEEETI